MSISPIQFSLPFFKHKESAESAECFYTKIALFAIGLILLLAGSLILSGIAGNIGGDIGWSITALGVVALAISCVRCHCKMQSHERLPDSYINLPNPPVRPNPLPTWPTLQEDTPPQRPFPSSSTVGRIGNPSPSHPKNTKSEQQKKAEEYFEQGDLAAALTEIKKVSDDKIKEPFFALLAEAYLARGDKEQAFDTIKAIYHNHKIKENFLAKLAEAYLARGDKEQAFDTIKAIYHNNGIKDLFLAKLAETYLIEGNKKQAFDTIRDIFHNTEIKDLFLAKLTRVYFAEGNKEQAFKTITEISINDEIKDIFLAELVQAYFNEKNESGVIKIIAEVMQRPLSIKLIREHSSKYFEIRKRHITNTKVEDFFNEIARECCEEVKIYLARGESINAINLAKNKTNQPKYVKSFLDL